MYAYASFVSYHFLLLEYVWLYNRFRCSLRSSFLLSSVLSSLPLRLTQTFKSVSIVVCIIFTLFCFSFRLFESSFSLSILRRCFFLFSVYHYVLLSWALYVRVMGGIMPITQVDACGPKEVILLLFFSIQICFTLSLCAVNHSRSTLQPTAWEPRILKLHVRTTNGGNIVAETPAISLLHSASRRARTA